LLFPYDSTFYQCRTSTNRDSTRPVVICTSINTMSAVSKIPNNDEEISKAHLNYGISPSLHPILHHPRRTHYQSKASVVRRPDRHGAPIRCLMRVVAVKGQKRAKPRMVDTENRLSLSEEESSAVILATSCADIVTRNGLDYGLRPREDGCIDRGQGGCQPMHAAISLPPVSPV
jgi:hypothetical protein